MFQVVLLFPILMYVKTADECTIYFITISKTSTDIFGEFCMASPPIRRNLEDNQKGYCIPILTFLHTYSQMFPNTIVDNKRAVPSLFYGQECQSILSSNKRKFVFFKRFYHLKTDIYCPEKENNLEETQSFKPLTIYYQVQVQYISNIYI